MKKFHKLLLEAKKALATLVLIESTAVGLGLLDDVTAGTVTAALGVATTAVVYVLKNEKSIDSAVADAIAAAKRV